MFGHGCIQKTGSRMWKNRVVYAIVLLDIISEKEIGWTLRLLEEKSKVVLETPVSKDTIGRTLKKLSKTSQK